MMDEIEELIYVGEEAKKFKSSPIGKRILAAAKAEEASGLHALSVADPHDVSAIMDIQQDIRVARAVPGWIQQTIADGDVACQEYIQNNS